MRSPLTTHTDVRKEPESVHLLIREERLSGNAELSEAEAIAQQIHMAVDSRRAVDDSLFASAIRIFEQKRLVDLVLLAGCYLVVCSLLNAFEVPAPDSTH